jgi:hypothetical protein
MSYRLIGWRLAMPMAIRAIDAWAQAIAEQFQPPDAGFIRNKFGLPQQSLGNPACANWGRTTNRAKPPTNMQRRLK